MWRGCALAVLVMGAVACGSGASSAGQSTDPVSTPSSVVQVAGVPDALDFAGPLVGGGTVDGASLQGRPTVLWFWAPT